MIALEKFIGNWHQITDTEIMTEVWQKASGKSFEGVGKIYDNDQNEKSMETLRILEMSGEIFYVAKVSQNEFPKAFKLTKCNVSNFIFENAEHDFPKKIEYLFEAGNMLRVSVSGEGEDNFQIDFARVP